MDMEKEAKARILINDLLRRSNYRFFDDETGPANIALEANVKLKKKALDALGEDFEKTANGFVDYLLLDEGGFPLAVLEAKSEKYDPLIGKEKARKYAHSQNVRFVILSNGNLHYFWDLEQGNPVLITEFPKPESFGHFHAFKPNPDTLVSEKVEADYVAVTQNPNYHNDPRWSDAGQRDAFIKETELKFLRPYQLRAVAALQDAVRKGQTRFLFEMATGTGKTLTSAAVIKLFMRTGNAKRVLFLVDRLELETQAWKAFVRLLKSDFRTVIYKENRDDWRKAEIVVSTVQSLQFNNKYRRLFSPTDFDLLISDEAHRSIGGNSRAVFEYFIGYKLGLTATPKDYLKRIDPARISERDPRAWERRQLLDTYKTFGCESSAPTFRYSLIEGVREGYLLNPVVVDARTEITTELLAEEGYSVMQENEDGELVEQTFFGKDFEKKFFSDETNRVFCETFLKNALRDPLSGEIGKSIVFCVRQDHAKRIVQKLNEMAHALFPGKYNSDFAVQVTSLVPDAQQMALSFANNNLSGHTRFLEGYISSKTRACVTVGMMTTGYDCEDLLNIVLLRPIFSPTDFIQIKGRGTRKFTFRYTEKDGNQVQEHIKPKGKFKLFDFFAVCEYFEEKFNYDEIIELPPLKGGGTGGGGGGVTDDDFTNVNPDPLKRMVETPVPVFGMKIDRKFFERFEDQVKAAPEVRERYERGDIKGAEEIVIASLFNKPEDFFDLAKLRKAVQLDRRITLREILAKAFGEIDRFKTKDELLEEELAKFVSIHKPDAEHIHVIRQFFKAYVTDGGVRAIVDSREFGRLADNPKVSLADVRALDQWREIIEEYVKDYVSLNAFAA
ncbi:MAG: restriction endonuclease subunit R [Nitrospirae bacterium CG_4_9_14_3_um_filter_53_35]|nr:MAG: restriction endonuclease subunit R [Nitrospirae bacterium CG08_land_8_20_14_0_20_52_24]PIW84693.1 MAG: restriction endonuclease subunit R [Nitrospirae bacterium CG_4_8_14_3_um_filter_50_41]PIX84779.1 MAG: restriction endonuclease subunit R [Nitrospirae bacterium CG_4_10_14_3_um_filter_53_41]PJA75377.1 MAG: restriction endonuclease subunit R [Nitrospirae bacterium CG_4_9_14_3_um_filter_53_35]